MRISDWSSDVCSSDLDPRSGLAEAGRLTRDGEVAQQVQLVPHADARAPHPTDDRLGTETESLEPVEGDLHGRRFDPHRPVGGGNHVAFAAAAEVVPCAGDHHHADGIVAARCGTGLRVLPPPLAPAGVSTPPPGEPNT